MGGYLGIAALTRSPNCGYHVLARTPRLHSSIWALVLSACLLAVACGGGATQLASPGGNGGKLQVVTTTALLADLVKNVGGGLVEVRSIVPPGADVHSFQTTPGDSVALSRAQVIVSNGSGLDAFLEPVLSSAKGEGALRVIASEGLDHNAARLAADGELANDIFGDGADPHFWQNPEFAIYYVERIGDGLANADPEHGPDYLANAGIYAGQLRAMDQEIAQELSQVPPDRRHLVTFHSAFGHLAQHYGWRASSFVAGDAGDPSPATVVRMLDRVSSEMLPAVFVEPQFRSEVIRRAAQDAGVSIGTIYSDVSAAGAPTYIDMMRLNAQTLVEFLK